MAIQSTIQFTNVAPDTIVTPPTNYFSWFQSDGSTATLSPGSPTTIAGSVYRMDSSRNLTLFVNGVASVTNVDGTLTISPTTGAVIAKRAAITGDVAIPLGSNTSTLATVNGNVGTFGDASHAVTITANGKGLITAISQTTIQIAESQVTNLVSDLAGKQPTGNYITALTGDVTATGPGSVTATLATVNGNVGTFGSATQVTQVTLNAKGLATAASSVSIQIAESQVTNLTTDLAAKVPTSRTITTTTPLTIDGGASADLSANRTIAMPQVTPSAAGYQSAADKKKEDQIWKDAVTDGGCDPTGASDCTAKIQAIHDAFGSTGTLTIFFPQGVYRFDSAVNLSKEGVYILGASRRNAKLCSSSASASVFNIDGDAVLIEGVRFSTIVGGVPDNTTLRTAGFAVTFNSASDSSGMRKCDILFYWSAIHSSGSLQFFDDLNIREYGNNAINGSGILIDGTGDRYIHRLTTDNGSNPTGFSMIRVVQCASLVVSDSNIIHGGMAMSLEPTAGLTVPSVEVVNTFFDTSTTGLAVTPGSGSVFRSKFTNCWFGSNTGAGVQLTGTSWDALTFTNCDFYGNVNGVSLLTSANGRIEITDSRFAGNSTAGINAIAGCDLKVHGCTFGSEAAFGINGTAINLAAGTYINIDIQSNTFISNASTTAIVDAGAVVNTGASKIILLNPGLVQYADPIVAAPAGTPITTTTETIIFTLKAPIQTVLPGTTVKFTASGIITATTPTILAKLHVGQLGTVSDATAWATPATAVATGTGWIVEGHFTVRTVGAGGTGIGNGIVHGTAPGKSPQNTTIGVNTVGGNLTFLLTLTISGTTPSCSVTNAFAEIVRQ